MDEQLKPKVNIITNDDLFRVHSVLEFLRWTKTNKLVKGEGGLVWEQSHIYYRGQANAEWGLLPGLFRGDADNNGILLDEHKLLQRANLRFWNTLSQMPTYLERLVFLQHFGLPTRLLDVTFNPLVALYMACADDKWNDADGKVFFGYPSYDSEQPDIAELTAQFGFEIEGDGQDYNIRDFISKQGAKVGIDQFTRPLFIFPPINNTRIESQDGAFIMAPLLSRDADGVLYSRNVKGLDGTSYFNKENHILIDGKSKKRIIDELASLGVDCGTIYRDTPHKIEALVKKLRSEWTKLGNI